MRPAISRSICVVSDRLLAVHCLSQQSFLKHALLVESQRRVSNKRSRHNENIGRRDPWPTSRSQVMTAKQNFDYFLVLDFEATCEQNSKIQPVQEIIEFPVVQLCAKTMDEVARFHEYVRPTERPILTSFCSNLTGIVQEMVDEQMILSDVLSRFHRWLCERKLIDFKNGNKLASWTFVTCGDWDLGTMLPGEAAFRGIQLPSYFDTWINLKKAYCYEKGYFPNSLMRMLNDLQITHTGRLHTGIDDVLNMCAILRRLSKDGCVFENTSQLTNGLVIGQRTPQFGGQRRAGKWGKRS